MAVVIGRTSRCSKRNRAKKSFNRNKRIWERKLEPDLGFCPEEEKNTGSSG